MRTTALPSFGTLPHHPTLITIIGALLIIFFYALQVNFSFFNPDGQQLSSEFVPLPTIYLLFLLFWVILLVMWVTNWILHRRVKFFILFILLPFYYHFITIC